MLDLCIINFARGAWYPRGQRRLVQSLLDVRYPTLGDFAFFQNETELGCPPHEEVPYGFKVAAFNHVAGMGFKLILWCDAAVWAIKPLDPLFDRLKNEGHLFFTGTWGNCARWTSDACLKQMDVTRDEAEKMPHYMACCMGLNLNHPRSVEFLTRLTRYAWDGISFHGSWTNDHQEVSADPRCHGHRHDQSVGSILASQLGMEQIPSANAPFAYYNNAAGTPYRYGEANDMTGVRENVVLLSQGM